MPVGRRQFTRPATSDEPRSFEIDRRHPTGRQDVADLGQRDLATLPCRRHAAVAGSRPSDTPAAAPREASHRDRVSASFPIASSRTAVATSIPSRLAE